MNASFLFLFSLRGHVQIRFCAFEEGYIERSKMSRSWFAGL